MGLLELFKTALIVSIGTMAIIAIVVATEFIINLKERNK